MAILRNKDVLKLSHQEAENKINELKLELIKSSVTAQKSKAKTKEIKRTLARIYTMNAQKSHAQKQEASKK
ncbi:MAG: 50S ribosomal protein L29 [Nanoarchaeota archaeon]